MLLDFDERELLQLFVVNQVIELSGQHGETVAELAVTEKQTVSGKD